GWMRAIGLRRAIILGRSVGWARLAARSPAMTLGVILVSPTMGADISYLTFLLRGLRDLAREPGVLASLMAYGSIHVSPWRILRAALHALDDQCETVSPAIQAPTLVVRGGRDPVSSQRWAERVAGAATPPAPLVAGTRTCREHERATRAPASD